MTDTNNVKQALREAIDIAHGQTALARLIGGTIKQGHVYYWLKVGRIPPKQAQRIDRKTGVSKRRLCPDFDWDDDPAPKRKPKPKRH